MTFVTVFRRVPTPIIGTVGTVYDRSFVAFEASLDWLETTGLVVERFDPSASPDEVMSRPAVAQLLSAAGEQVLPLILVNDREVSRGKYLSRSQLARAVGGEQGDHRFAA